MKPALAFDTVVGEAPHHASLEGVPFCCFSESDAAIFRELLRTLGS